MKRSELEVRWSCQRASKLGEVPILSFMNFNMGCMKVRLHQGHLSLAATHREVESQMLMPSW